MNLITKPNNHTNAGIDYFASQNSSTEKYYILSFPQSWINVIPLLRISTRKRNRIQNHFYKNSTLFYTKPTNIAPPPSPSRMNYFRPVILRSHFLQFHTQNTHIQKLKRCRPFFSPELYFCYFIPRKGVKCNTPYVFLLNFVNTITLNIRRNKYFSQSSTQILTKFIF